MDTNKREIWFKGVVKAVTLFSDTTFSTATKQLKNIQLSQIEINQTVVLDKFEPKLEKKDPYLEYLTLSDVKIRFKGTSHEQIAFNEDIETIVIRDVKYLQKVAIDGQIYYVLEGIIYFKKAVIPIQVPTINIDGNIENVETLELDTKNEKVTSISDYAVYAPFVPPVTRRSETDWQHLLGTQKRWFGWDLLFMLFFGFITYKTLLFPVFLIVGGIYLLYSLKSLYNSWYGFENKPNGNISSGGCFSTIFYIFALIAMLVCFYLGKNEIAKIIVGIICLTLLFKILFSGSNFSSKILNLLGGIFILFLIFLGFTYLTKNKKAQHKLKDDEKIDFQDKNKAIKTGDSLLHYRDWKTLSSNQLDGKYYTQYPQFFDSEIQRKNLNETQLPDVYYKLIQKDKLLLNSYIALFDSIQKVRNFNQIELADAIVSSIQSIPYVLVHEGSCQSAINNGNSSFIIQYHRQGKECLPNIKYGVQSGYEFMHNLKGDCDTRTLLCFEILNHFKYSVAMLLSLEYGHCILGVELPLHGLSLSSNNHNYLVWETTAKGFKPGELAPEISNLNKWSIGLTN